MATEPFDQIEKTVVQKPNLFQSLITKTSMSYTWYVVLMTYISLLLLTGFITFFSSNDYATNAENMAKITKDYGDTEKAKLVQKLLREDIQQYKDVKEIGSQSFNVILGAILSFLVTTFTGQIKAEQKR